MKRFPLGLTILACAVFAILISLGVWQLRRMDETSRHRARLAALAHAPALPLDEVLARAASAGDLDHTRVSVRCQAPAQSSPPVYRYSVSDGQVSWRLLSLCRLAGPTYDGLVVDRGRIDALAGAMTPQALSFSEPVAITGVLRALGGAAMLGDAMPAGDSRVRLLRVLDKTAIATIVRLSGARAPMPYYLVAESETPAPAGVTPAVVAEDVPRDNFGYALTWFGLAAGLACVYAAMVWRRLRTR